MRAIVIFASLMAVALARPDVSHLAQQQGYQYTSPAAGGSSSGASANTAAKGTYSGGNNQFAGSSNNYNTQSFQGQSGQSSSGSNGFGGQQSTVGYNGNAQSFGGSSGQSGAGSFGGSSNGFGSQQGSSNGFIGGSSSGYSGSGSSSGFGGQQGSGFSSGQSTGFGGQQGSGFGGSGSSSYSGAGTVTQGQSQSIDLSGGSGGDRVVYKPVIKQGEPIITKNFYVHAAPEEDENVRVEEKVQVVRPQKSYKIIFIKAPSSGSSFNAANYPVFPQNEEKTIVYVLSKKDDSVSEFGEIPTPPPAVTHKPEVYFIKYKTKQEAADAVANIQAQYKGDGASSAGISGASGSDSSTGSFVSSGSASFGPSGGSNFGSTDSGAANFGSTGGSSGGSYSSSGSNNFGSTSSGSDLSSQDFRDETIDTSFLPNIGASNGGQSTSFQSSSSTGTSFGPSGGQVSLQSSSFGPSGGSSISQTHQIDSTGHVQHQSTSIGGGANDIVPQVIMRIDDDESAFAGLQNYLPPNRL